MSLLLLLLLPLLEAVTLHRHLLSSHPLALCNDGSPASYFLPPQPHTPGQPVLLYLEGGGGCFDIPSCEARCAIENPELCTTDPLTERNLTGSVWSGEQAENPGLHDSYKVAMGH